MSSKRENKFHGNIPAWIKMSEIDYFSQFVKAWIPFNAWFSTAYPNENTDREIISRIKNETNPFRDKIITHLTSNDAASLEFLNLIGKLHLQLENNVIPSVKDKITFTNVIIDKNNLPLMSNFVRGRGYTYKVEVKYNHSAPIGTQKINVQVIELISNSGKMNWTQNEWDINELKANGQFKLLGISKGAIKLEVQNEIINCYNQINPLKPTNLILQPQRKSRKNPQFIAPINSITIDALIHLYFIDETEKIAKALIEILYNLRNALFHGEINPSYEVQKIYKEAYYILYSLIKVLN